jgi:hypothetical protein
MPSLRLVPALQNQRKHEVSMPSSERFFLAIFVFLLTAGMATSAKADTTYSFVSADFNILFGATCPPTCNVTGSLTLANPLAPNLMQDVDDYEGTTPLSFSFTDGTIVFDNLNASNSGFAFQTNDLGIITNYSFLVFLPNLSQLNVYSQGSPFMFKNVFVGNNNGPVYEVALDPATPVAAGTWTVSTSGIPEPSSLALLGVGILALAGLALKKS